jgi:ribonucleoside-diphosphate reductase alpha chain
LKKDWDVFESKFAYDIFLNRYSLNKQEKWEDTCKRVVESVCGQYLDNEVKSNIFDLIYKRIFIPGGRYLASAGRPLHQICNCFALKCDDSREGWANLLYKITMMLSTGGGVGVDYSDVRCKGTKISKTGGEASGPLSAMEMCNEIGRHIRSGGDRRSALWAGLNWAHGDIKSFLTYKNRTPLQQSILDNDSLFPMPLDGTNISVIYDSEFFRAIENKNHEQHNHAKEIWNLNCRQAFSTAEPGFSFNFLKDNESLRNACAEYTTEDDSDSCNLGTIYINRIKSKDEMIFATNNAISFLLCGGLYTDCPTPKCREMRNKNNRIGLGIGGIAEWMIRNQEDYYVGPELHKILSVWKHESDSAAYMWSKNLGITIPKAKRAIAPNGTTSILSNTTGGIEPIFCKAYKRRYYDNGSYKYQFVVDSSVKKLLDDGIPLEKIKDAYDISFKERVKVQADFQNYTDMSISSTCNLPSWGSEKNNEETLKDYSKILLKYAKRLRGFTCYPDGCRNGQPLNRCDIKEALENEGKIFESKEDLCTGGICGI